LNNKMNRSYINEVQKKLEEINRQVGVDVRVMTHKGGTNQTVYPIYSVNVGEDKGRRVLLSAGIHGDEPAGVYALLDFLNGPILEYSNLNFSVFPCLNPWGFEHDSRYNANGNDINRCFVRNNSHTAVTLKNHIRNKSGYLFALNLHEDNTFMKVDGFQFERNPRGFYVYETPLNGSRLGFPLTVKLRSAGIEICADNEIYGEKNEDGVVITLSNDGEFEGFLEKHTKDVLVTETPTCWPLEKRVHAQKEALYIALDLIK